MMPVAILAVLSAILGVGTAAQAPPQEPRGPERPADPGDPDAVFRSGVTVVTTVVTARDWNGAFLDDLSGGDFLVFEDGRPRPVASLFLVREGSVVGDGPLAAPLLAPEQSVLLPAGAAYDPAGRVFLILVDDLHIASRDVFRARAALGQLADNLIHEGDLFAVVPTGPSPIATNLIFYDRDRLEAAADGIIGHGFDPTELIENFRPDPQGAPELRARARQAFGTMREVVRLLLEQVQHRRKVVIYLSGGYDLDPFVAERRLYFGVRTDPRFESLGAAVSAGELARDIAELAEAAYRADALFYTVDPRGLVAGPQPGDLHLKGMTGTRSFHDWLFMSQNSLRSLAEPTGGRAIVNRNDFDDAFMEIDDETNDYYVLGFYSDDSDPTPRTRRLLVEVQGRDDVDVQHATNYTYAGRSP